MVNAEETNYEARLTGLAEESVSDSTKRRLGSHSSSLTSLTSLGSLRRKYLQACCQPSYRLRWLHSKGAILVLIWNFLAISIYHYLQGYASQNELLARLPFIRNHSYVVISVIKLFYPIAGWLTDVYFSRYKVMRTSLWMMWIGIVLSVGGLLLHEVNSTANAVFGYGIFPVLYVLMLVGLGIFQANVIQFGVDQLLDASASEITAFVNWYVWTVFSSGIVLTFALGCLEDTYSLTKSLFVAISVSLALCTEFFFKNRLVAEPANIQNPLNLIAKVLKFRYKHKHPKQRSAFTYWEDKLPMRIDLAKQKYGGPHTNEEVEDVKTFIRMLATILTASVFLTVNIADSGLQSQSILQYSAPNASKTTACYNIKSVSYLDHYVIVLLVPLYELVVLPIFSRCIPNVGIFHKFGIGVVLTFANVLSVLTLDVLGRHFTNNATDITCPFLAKESSPVLDIDYRWLVVPGIIRGISVLFLFVAVIEFVCAQSPYNMRGILIGLIYGILGLFTILDFLVLLPFVFYHHGKGYSHCGFWYYLVVAIVVVVTLIIFCVVAKWYKKRERDETLNDQVFVETYYERYGGGNDPD